MKAKRLLKTTAFFAMLLWAGWAMAQQAMTVSGKVSDAKDGSPLIGVSVTVKGTTIGTSTDNSGNFTLRVQTGAELVFSYIGFLDVTRKATATEMDVLMEGAKTPLNEVVVVGYGRTRKQDLTGSIATIKSDDFQTGNIPSPEQLISGKVAGVQIVSGSAPGAGSAIRIRGGASLNASNDPLIVIDGVPVDNGGIAGSPNPLSMINPNDIESFNVLKDASATAIYGSRASNGVIIITTKKGTRGKPKFNFSTSVSLQTPAKYVDVLSAEDFRTVIENRGTANQIARMGTASTDWQKVIYQNALANDNNLSVSGAVGKMPYRASLGYTYQDGILKTDNMKRLTGSINLNPKFFDNHLNVNLNLKGTNSNFRFANQGAIGAAVRFDPTQPVNVADQANGGYFEWIDNATGRPNTLATRNPLGLLELNESNSTVQRAIGNVQLDYKFHFLPELRANLNLGFDYSKGEGTVFIPEYAGSQRAQNRAGVNNEYSQEKEMKLMEFYLNYVKDLKSIKSRIDVMGGYSYQDFLTINRSFPDRLADGTINPNSPLPLFPNDYPRLTLISFFGRLNYTFNDKYLLTATYRRDGSSRFSESQRWGDFPSFAFAWKIKEESFLKTSNTFSDLKLRIGYGITGQQDIGPLFGYLPIYTLSNNAAQYAFGNEWFNGARPSAYVADLKWEETAQWNVGIDFGFLQNRITGAVDYFYKESTDLFGFVNIPAGSNFTNGVTTNIGSLVSKGLEFTLNTVPVRNDNVEWNLGFNATWNDIEITKLSNFDDPNAKGVQVGGIAGGTGNTIQIHSVGYRPSSFFVYKQIYNPGGTPVEGLYEDMNRDGITNEDDLYRYQAPNPIMFFGINSDIKWGNFTAATVLRANLGNYVYNNTRSGAGVYRSILDPANYLSNGTRDVLFTNFENNQYFSDYYIQNASFLRMDNFSVGYDLGKLLGKNTRLNVQANVQNVFVVTQYTGLDPEVFGGIDNNFYPRPRTYTLSFNLGF